MPASPTTEVALHALRDLLNRPAPLLKLAELGGDKRQQFEQAFSSLGHSVLADQAPALLQYELGFQLLEKNQDGTRAVGVFAFKVGEHFLYAPVFFLNGDVKGHELLYLKNQDLFCPLKDSWVNYLLGRKSLELGSGVDRNLSRLGVQGPSLFQLSRVPTKYAAATHPGWRKEAAAAVGGLAATRPSLAYGPGPFDPLATLLKESAHACRATLAWCRAHPPLLTHLDRFHPGLLEQAVTKHASRTATWGAGEAPDHVLARVRMDAGDLKGADAYEWAGQYGRSARGNPRKGPSLLETLRGKRPEGEAAEKAAAAKDRGEGKGKLDVRTLTRPGGPDVSDLSTQERERLLRARYFVRDGRDASETSRAYSVEAPLALRNPDATGVYEVLVRPDRFKKCLVVLQPLSSRGRADFCTVVDLDTRSWCNAHPHNVWVTKEMGGESFQAWFEKLVDAGAEPDGHCLLLTRGGVGTVPFTVHDAREGLWDVSYRDYASASCGLGEPASESLGPRSKPSPRNHGVYHPLCDRIRFTGRPGGKLSRREGGEVWAPEGVKALSLKAERKDGVSAGPLELGNLADVQLLLRDATYEASVSLHKSGYCLRTPSLRKEGLARPDAVAGLLLDLGLGEKQAVALLDRADARPGGATRFLVKAAGPWAANLIDGAPSAPSHPTFPQGHDPFGSGRYPAEEPFGQRVPVEDLASRGQDAYQRYDPTVEPDQMMIRAVAEAAQTGQQEVFDTAMLGGLLKTVRDDAVIDRYLPDLTKGMNALGRLLFSFYWHQDNFADRYGKDDLDEIQDGLRNSFEGIGEILLTLKAKKVDPGLDEGLSSQDDLEDVANV